MSSSTTKPWLKWPPLRPATQAAFATFPGVGETKRTRYGAAFLEVINAQEAKTEGWEISSKYCYR